MTTVLELRWDVFRRDSSRASRYLPSPSTTLIHVRRMLLLGCPPRSRDGGRRAAARIRTSACRSRSRPLIDDPAGSCRAGQGSLRSGGGGRRDLGGSSAKSSGSVSPMFGNFDLSEISGKVRD